MKKTKIDTVEYSWETTVKSRDGEEYQRPKCFYVTVGKCGKDYDVSLSEYLFSATFNFDLEDIDNIIEALESVKAKYGKYAKKKED